MISPTVHTYIHNNFIGGNANTAYVVSGLVVVGVLSYLYLGSALAPHLPAVSKSSPADKQLPSSPKKKSNRVFANE